MIYLIRATYYDNDTEEILDLLKIGYTKDSSKDKRFTQYKLHNPCFKVLYEVPKATEDHEKRIQYKFRDLLYSGKEWFKYSEDIIDFFKNIKSLKDLDKIPRNTNDKRHLKYKNKVKEAIKYLTPDVTRKKEFYDLCKDIFNYLGERVVDWDYVLGYLRTRFGDSKVNKYLEIIKSRETGIYCEDPEINEEVCRFMEKYNSMTRATEKMKYLCESAIFGTISSSTIEVVLDQIPDSDYIKSYYKILGPQKIRALEYKRVNIEKALGIITFSDDLLKRRIYSEFKKGEKYTLANLKTKLGSLYSSINYNSTPKANDIEKWFNISGIVMYEKDQITGKRRQIRGYELLDPK